MVFFYLNVLCFAILFNYGIQQRYDVVEVIEVSKNPTNVRYNQQYGYNRNFNEYPYAFNYRYPNYPYAQYMPNAYPRYPSSMKYNYGNPYRRPEPANSNYGALPQNNDYTILAIEVPTNALHNNPNLGKEIQAIISEKPVASSESSVFLTTVSVSKQTTSTTTAAAIPSSTNANKKRKRNKKKKSKQNSTSTETSKSDENDDSEENEQYDIDVRSLNSRKDNLTRPNPDNLPIWTD